MNRSILLTTQDYAGIKARLGPPPPTSAGYSPRQRLIQEIERADLLPSEVVPEAVIRIGSVFTIRDLSNQERDTFTLVWPEAANVEAGCISVLAPLGTAVLGYSQGEVVDWEMPGGPRRFVIEAVRAPTRS